MWQQLARLICYESLASKGRKINVVVYMHTGSQAGRIIGVLAGIIAGSMVGGLMILLLLVAIIATLVYLVLKRKIISANFHEDTNRTVDDIFTSSNPAYKSVQCRRAAANHKFEVVCDASGTRETTMELQELNETPESELKMERNVAYQSSTISLHLNVAYESRRVLEKNDQVDGDDYI